MAKKAKSTRKAGKRTAARRAPAPPPKPRTVTPYLSLRHAAEAIEWYKKALGAKETARAPSPDGLIWHAGIRVGDSDIYLSDIFPGAESKDPLALGNSPVTLHVWTKDLDRLWKRAVAAGAKVEMPLDDQFWGDRYGTLKDPFGHHWSLSYKSKASKAVLDRKREEAMRTFGAEQKPYPRPLPG